MSQNVSVRAQLLAGAMAGLLVSSFSGSALAVDAGAAKKLARQESCLRCHAVDKKKEGPSYQAIAYKYKGQPDAQGKLVEHITVGDDRVKLSDGHMEDHKITKTKDTERINNLIAWILAQ
jgi:cytochrome c